jgi:hypothetical protein
MINPFQTGYAVTNKGIFSSFSNSGNFMVGNIAMLLKMRIKLFQTYLPYYFTHPLSTAPLGQRRRFSSVYICGS